MSVKPWFRSCFHLALFASCPAGLVDFRSTNSESVDDLPRICINNTSQALLTRSHELSL
jgi:hypothetical protein